jgi:hypothetical protein
MTTFCRIVLTVVSCTVDPATPAPTPADAVAIFRASSPPFQAAPEVEPSSWDVSGALSYDRDWPFAQHVTETSRMPATGSPNQYRLDGTSTLDPPTVYGYVPYAHGWYGQSGRTYRGPAGWSQRGIGPDTGGPRPLRSGKAADRAGGEGRAGRSVPTTSGRQGARPAGGGARDARRR